MQVSSTENGGFFYLGEGGGGGGWGKGVSLRYKDKGELHSAWSGYIITI